MRKLKEQYVLNKTLISDNGIDEVYRPILNKEEYERRKKYLEEAGRNLVREQERIHSSNKYN